MRTAAAPARRLLAITAGPAGPAPEPPRPPAVQPPEQPAGGIADPDTPPPRRPQEGRLGVRGEQTRRLTVPLPPPPPSEVLGWIVNACAAAGHQPAAVTVSAVTHDAHIHVASPEAFWGWCGQLGIRPGAVRRSKTLLGRLAEATTTVNGWAVHVRLFGPAVEELK